MVHGGQHAAAPSSNKDPEQTLAEKTEQDEIRKAIDRIPEKQRMAFILSRYEELPQKEVAQIMEISEGAVEQLLLRARDNLKNFYCTHRKPFSTIV